MLLSLMVKARINCLMKTHVTRRGKSFASWMTPVARKMIIFNFLPHGPESW